jgi:hypothetical protein
MSLQYLEALKALGASPATKFIIPMEFTRLLDPFVDFLSPQSGSGDGGAGGGGGSAEAPRLPERRMGLPGDIEPEA